MPAAPMIDVEMVTKRFGATLALDEVSFSVGQGEVLALLGPNGAGKTTLIRVLTTLAGGRQRPGPGSGPGRPEGRQGDPVGDRARRPVRHRRRAAHRPGEPRAHRAALSPGQGGVPAPRAGRPRAHVAHRRRRTIWSRPTRAACDGGLTWRPASSGARRCCSLTSRPPALTPGRGTTCGSSSRISWPRARRCCSRPSTWKKPSTWPGPSSSWTPGASPPREPPTSSRTSSAATCSRCGWPGGPTWRRPPRSSRASTSAPPRLDADLNRVTRPGQRGPPGAHRGRARARRRRRRAGGPGDPAAVARRRLPGAHRPPGRPGRRRSPGTALTGGRPMTDVAIRPPTARAVPLTLRLAVRDIGGITRRNLLRIIRTPAAAVHVGRPAHDHPAAVPLRAGRRHPRPRARLRQLRRARHLPRGGPDRRHDHGARPGPGPPGRDGRPLPQPADGPARVPGRPDPRRHLPQRAGAGVPHRPRARWSASGSTTPSGRAWPASPSSSPSATP